MRMLGTLGLGLALSVASFGAAAQTIDGTKPLVCASMESFDCAPGGSCIKGLARDIDAPQFIHLDFAEGVARTVRANGEEREAKISEPRREAGQLILQGVQEGFGWSLSIAKKNGAMALTITGEEVAFVIFGACTPS